MSSRSRQAIRLLLVVMFGLPVTVAAQLNPTVKVLPHPTATMPPECEEGLAPQPVPRPAPEERATAIPPAPAMKAPPSKDLRHELQAAVEVARANNREGFRDALANVKTILSNYPPGGEESAARDVVAVLDDIDKVWDFEFSSPTGAFFSDASDIHQIFTRYPGYESFVRRQVLVDRNGNRFYPTHESIEFLTSEAEARLARLTGKPVAARPRPRERERVAVTPAAAPKAERHAKPAEASGLGPRASEPVIRHVHREKAAAKPKPAPAKTSTAIAEVTPPAAPRKKAVTPPPAKITPAKRKTAAPKPAAVTPATAPFAAKTSTAPPPARPLTTTSAPPPARPATTATSAGPSTTSAAPAPATTTTAPLPVTTTTATTTTVVPTTGAPAETTATAAAPAQPAKPATSGKPNLIIPIVLIIVGLGVLVALFRASS